jgi:hypothetical protein
VAAGSDGRFCSRQFTGTCCPSRQLPRYKIGTNSFPQSLCVTAATYDLTGGNSRGWKRDSNTLNMSGQRTCIRMRLAPEPRRSVSSIRSTSDGSP